MQTKIQIEYVIFKAYYTIKTADGSNAATPAKNRNAADDDARTCRTDSQEMVSNPVLEEVTSSDELNEIAERILDQNANGQEDFDARKVDGENDMRSERDSDSYDQYEDYAPETPTENGNKEDSDGDSDFERDDFSEEKSDSFDEIDYGRSFRNISIPVIKRRKSNTRKMRRVLNSFYRNRKI